jgi:hypothetical protein
MNTSAITQMIGVRPVKMNPAYKPPFLILYHQSYFTTHNYSTCLTIPPWDLCLFHLLASHSQRTQPLDYIPLNPRLTCGVFAPCWVHQWLILLSWTTILPVAILHIHFSLFHQFPSRDASAAEVRFSPVLGQILRTLNRTQVQVRP